MNVRIAKLPPNTGDVPQPAGDAEENEAIAAYLAAGTPILVTSATGADQYVPNAGRPVPLSVRSDGVWAWSDAITYYLRRYGLLPEPDLCAHIRAAGYRCPPLTEAQATAALAAFTVVRHSG